MKSSIAITVNGSRHTVDDGATLTDLLAELDLDPRLVVVEYNRSVIRRPALPDTILVEGDAIELVHFVGGG